MNGGGTVLDVVIPVHNEEAQLEDSVERVLAHLAGLPWSYQVTIADNASSDQTTAIAQKLCDQEPAVRLIQLAQKGRGRALRAAWGSSPSEVLVYMDVDLSTDLAALHPLVVRLISGECDIAAGTRFHRTSKITRGIRRELISRGYNTLLQGLLQARFSDAQCGFKAIRGDAARALLPMVEDISWFFDTELLVLAERAGLRIHEVPVTWVDDPDSSVAVVPTAIANLRGIARVAIALRRGNLPLSEIAKRLERTEPQGGVEPPSG